MYLTNFHTPSINRNSISTPARQTSYTNPMPTCPPNFLPLFRISRYFPSFFEGRKGAVGPGIWTIWCDRVFVRGSRLDSSPLPPDLKPYSIIFIFRLPATRAKYILGRLRPPPVGGDKTENRIAKKTWRFPARPFAFLARLSLRAIFPLLT